MTRLIFGVTGTGKTTIAKLHANWHYFPSGQLRRIAAYGATDAEWNDIVTKRDEYLLPDYFTVRPNQHIWAKPETCNPIQLLQVMERLEAIFPKLIIEGEYLNKGGVLASLLENPARTAYLLTDAPEALWERYLVRYEGRLTAYQKVKNLAKAQTRLINFAESRHIWHGSIAEFTQLFI
jgi:hypothetical protein